MTLIYNPAHHTPAPSQTTLADLDQGDRVIENSARSMLAGHLPGPVQGEVTVSVRGGVASLRGAVSDSRWLARFKNQLTAAFPGIVIEDELDWVVPDCGVGYA